MNHYFDHMLIDFTDGTSERYGGNRMSLLEGILSVWTDSTLGGARDGKSWPLSGIRSYRWEEE